YDEGDFARQVAAHCGTKHREIPLDGSALLGRIDEAIAALDLPTMDAVNTYFVSWAAREAGLKVALSGLGGDELFAGYTNFANTARLRKLIRAAWFVPTILRHAAAGLIGALVSTANSQDRVGKALAAWNQPDALPHPYFFTRALFPPGQIETLIDPQY